MIKYPSFLVVFLMIFTAVSLYQIKHFITKKEIELAETNKAIKTKGVFVKATKQPILF